jgi:hypothetical protein
MTDQVIKDWPPEKVGMFLQFKCYYDWLGKHPETLQMTADEAWEYYQKLTQ